MTEMIRTKILEVIEGVIKRFSGSGRPGETFTDREFFQHYGFSSRPKTGSEGIVFRDGNIVFMIASDDRRYRLALEDGEVALYTDEGDFIHLKRNREVHVSTRELTADVSETANITAPTVNLTGDVNMTGDFGLTGTLTVGGTTISSSGVSSPALSSTGNITAGGTIMDTSGNSNHHSHA